ncbi:hypothetical protein RM717_16020 [Streptomyces griseus]|uniref:Uncharacterized protein n=1 Tax=Streptomyces stephensoniae TaxID=3375367 RepID=A0ABU2W2D1_9ACTN|nr:hypothetical protein [Streptomyces griseus]MDT0492018.1 hypothetical protein [Streptomyces griseus]
MFIGTLLVGPLLQLLFLFGYLGREFQVADGHFSLLGNAVFAASTSCVHGGTMAISDERRYGTRRAALLRPRHRAPLRIGRALPHVLNGLLISAFTPTAASSPARPADSARGPAGARGGAPRGGRRVLGVRPGAGGARAPLP